MTKKTRTKSAREIQDNIFRKMPAGKKIRLASNFFALARKLNKNWAKRYRVNSHDSEKTQLEISKKMGKIAINSRNSGIIVSL